MRRSVARFSVLLAMLGTHINRQTIDSVRDLPHSDLVFLGQEYKNLLITEKVLMASIQSPATAAEPAVLAQVSNALVKVLDYKRVLRMRPKPKDVDVTKLVKQAKPVIEPFDEPEQVTNG